ncbi:MAG TPA: P-II family nitrogen regulator [Azospirillaceae bacterium]|nr:P-II family nitrogen regulator [Azospirillaceae bacterium]
MQTHQRKKVEIVVERARAPALVEAIQKLGATGYTIIPDVSGNGRHGKMGHNEVLDVYRSTMIIVLAAEPLARRIMEEAHRLMENYTGIVWLSDVEVVRGDHF